MSYATLMAHLELGRANTALLKVAGDLADRLGASLTGIAACQPMRIIYSDGYVSGEVIEQDRQQMDDERKAAEAEFRAASGRRSEQAEWRSAVVSTPLSEYLAQEACRADLIITGVDKNASMFDSSRHVDIGDFVMQAGRPCLIVPAETESLSLDHILVAWKNSGETRRAIRDALPLLKAAGRVTVVEIAVEDDIAAAKARLADVAGWLKRHGIDSTPLVSASNGDDADRLSAIVREQGADLLVAGAYGHSRVREWVLGGVTRDLLLRAGRCALVSH
jgi:nucleotide-binding universal stress UspA family protein